MSEENSFDQSNGNSRDSGGDPSVPDLSETASVEQKPEPESAAAPSIWSLLWPFRLMSQFGSEDNLKLIIGSFFGLFPLAVVTGMGGENGLGGHGYWLFAFYFATLWAVFFRYLIPDARPGLFESIIFFYGVGFLSSIILRPVYIIFNLGVFVEMMHSDIPWHAFLGNWLGAGWPEELIKLFPIIIYVLFIRKESTLSTIVFLGLLSGLGFGIYEGVDYQKETNLVLAESLEEYYILNLLRLTALPFLHAVWTGIGAFFFGVGLRFGYRGILMIILGLVIPGLLHGTYNHLGHTTANFGVAIISVIIFNLYLTQISRIPLSHQRD